jgi:hypothetical protein
MVLKIIDDEKAIKKYAQQFARKFKPFLSEQIKVKLGHQGAGFPAKVSWSKKLGIWIFSRPMKNIRYWNAFGMDKPQPGAPLSITAEINFPWTGIDRKTGAAFAEDARRNIFVVHRGKIGGGKKGVGKSLFEHSYRGVWSQMEDGDCLSQVAIIGVLNSPRLALQTAQFVKKIDMLKSAAAPSRQTEIDFSEITFREDLVGNLPSSGIADVHAQCDRDLVISHLAELLRRWKFKTGNDDGHELFLVDTVKNRISHIFAVPVDNEEQSVLAAAAKLLLQTTDNGRNIQPFIILPEKEMTIYAPLLKKIGIDAIGFRLEEERITFPELGKITLDQNQQL